MDFYKKQKFSIRKLSLGVASVLIGMSLMLGSQTVTAQADVLVNKSTNATNQVHVDYLAVDKADLTVFESQLMTHGAISDEQAVTDDVYVLVYQKKQEGSNRLPQTGSESGLVSLALAGSLFVMVYHLGKKKSVLLGIAVLGTAGQLAMMNGAHATEVLQSIANHVFTFTRDQSLEELSLEGYDYVGYIRDESIPEDTKLYRLVESYKALRVQEKSLSAVSVATYPVDIKDTKDDGGRVNDVNVPNSLPSVHNIKSDKSAVESLYDKAEKDNSLILDARTESKDTHGEIVDTSDSTPDRVESSSNSDSVVDTAIPTPDLDNSISSEGSVTVPDLVESPSNAESTADVSVSTPDLDSSVSSEGSVLGPDVVAPPSSSEPTADGSISTPAPDGSVTSDVSVTSSDLVESPSSSELTDDVSISTPHPDSSVSSDGSVTIPDLVAPPSSSEPTADVSISTPAPDGSVTSEGSVTSPDLVDTPSSSKPTADGSISTPDLDSSISSEGSVTSPDLVESPSSSDTTADDSISTPDRVESSSNSDSVVDTAIPTPHPDSSVSSEGSVTSPDLVEPPSSPETTADAVVEEDTVPNTGSTDSVEEELHLAEVTAVQTKISLAKDEILKVELKKTAIESNELVTPSEHEELSHLIAIATVVYQDALSAWAALPASDDKTRLGHQLEGLVIPKLPVVNDRNSNNIVDTAGDAAKAVAHIEMVKTKVSEAIAKRTEMMREGVVNPTDKYVLDKLISEVIGLQTEGDKLVKALPISDRRTDLELELSHIIIPQTLTVNDNNSNGKVDTAGNVAKVATQVQSVTTKVSEVTTKREELSKQQVITDGDKNDLDTLIAQVSQFKLTTQKLVEELPDSDEKDKLLNTLDSLVIPKTVEVTQPSPVERELTETKIELKNVESAYLYRTKDNRFEKVLSIDQIGSDLTNYKVKVFLTDANKFMWLPVSSIVDEKEHYRVDASLDHLVSIKPDGTIAKTYSIKVAKRVKAQADEYTSFNQLIKAMKQNSQNGIIKGTYIIADNMTASESHLEDKVVSYLGYDTFSGTLKSKDGSMVSIHDLKKPLFNSLEEATVANIKLKDVDIDGTNTLETGSLANHTTRSRIQNVSVNGYVKGNEWVGGIVGVLDHESVLEDSTYTGSVSTLHHAGGLTGNVTRGSSIRRSFADIHIAGSVKLQDSIGGLSGQVNQNSSIEDSYVKGTLYNNGEKDGNVGGAIGGYYTTTGDRGFVRRVVTDVHVTNGRDFAGNMNELALPKEKTISDNYVVTDQPTAMTAKNTPQVRYVSKEDAESYVTHRNQELGLKSVATNSSKVDYRQLSDYRSTHQTAYDNLAKLLPFYDRYTIVREANKLSESDSLNTKQIKSIQTYAGAHLLRDLYKEKAQVDKLIVTFTDNSKEELPLTFKKEFEKTGILDYTIANKGILYHPNRFAQDRSALISALASDISSTTFDEHLFNPYNLLDWESSARAGKLGRLYLEDHFEKAKATAVDNLYALIDQYDIADYTKGEFKHYLETKIRHQKNKLLVGLNYLERWYDFSVAKDYLLYSLDSYATPYSSLDLVMDIGSQTIDTLASNITDSTYESVLAKYTGKKTLSDFVTDIYMNTKTEEQTDIDKWLKQVTRAYLVNVGSQSLPETNQTLFERLTSPHHRHWLLPLLTVKEEHVYGFFTSNSSNMGIFDPYVSVGKTSDKYSEEVSAVKRKVDESALAMQRYFDAWYRILEPASVKKLLETPIQAFDSYRNYRKVWSKEFGSGALASVKAFAGPIRRWDSETKSASAYAFPLNSIETVNFSAGDLLSPKGWSTLTHEHVHNLDRKVLFKGYGRRFGHGAESFAMGLLQTPSLSSDSMGINLVYHIEPKEKHLWMHNASPDQFRTAEDLQTYMKGVFDVLYTLDLAEAEVILSEGKEFIQNNYRKLSLEPGPGSADSDVVTRLSSLGKVTTLQDLINENIVGPTVRLNTYGYDNYILVDMFASHYGINENPKGASGGLTLRRVAFELLAEKGYYGGMVPYLSNQYFFEEGADKEIAKSDTYILHKIFDNQYSDFKAFRKAMFDKRAAKKDDLKEIQIWTRDNRLETIRSYNDIKRLMSGAIDREDWSELARIKHSIYHAYLVKTNAFKDSIYKR